MRRSGIKTKIRPFKAHASSEVEPEQLWAKLKDLLIKLQEGEFNLVPYISTYDLAYKLVLGRNGDMMYSNIRSVINSKLEKTCTEILVPVIPREGENISQAGERFCVAMSEAWQEHNRCMESFSCVCRYMETSWIYDARVPGLVDLGHELFRDGVMKRNQNELGDVLIATLLDLIKAERSGEMINRSAFKSCVEMLLNISSIPWSPSSTSEQSLANVYSPTWRNQSTKTNTEDSLYAHWFVPVLECLTSSFYEAEALALLQNLCISDYLKQVEKRLSEESLRSSNYFGAASTSQLVQIVEHQLITGKMDQIISDKTGLSLMINESKVEDFNRLRKLCIRTPNGEVDLKNGLKTQIAVAGQEINTSVSAANTSSSLQPSHALEMALCWVTAILALQSKSNSLIRTGMSEDPLLQKGVSEAFEIILSSNPRSQEFVSLYIDDQLRKNLKGKSDLEIEEVLNQVIVLFRYISDKDKFERYYKNHLARRLITAKSTSNDAEKALLSKMKVDCGYQFTQKMEGMFNDMKISSELTSIFKQKTIDGKLFDISVNVLTATYWPIPIKPPPCNFPSEVQLTCNSFEKFYLSRHSGRKITWHPDYGSFDIKATFGNGKRKHELNVSTYCAVVLLLFNESDSLTFDEISSATAIPENELKRTLQSLSCAKYKILTKSPKSREVSSMDIFDYNQNFSSPLIRIKVSLIAAKVETERERLESDGKIEEQRVLLTEASIVRIMKGRKTILHNELINEVMRQLGVRFQPSPTRIKKRIEALIEREYLERCETEKGRYNYLA